MWGDTVKKLFISQPMRGREYDAIMAERKALIADAAVALRTDDVEVLDTYFQHLDKPPLQLLARALEKMADADAVIFAPGWRDARGCRVEHVVASEDDLKIIHGKEVVV